MSVNTVEIMPIIGSEIPRSLLNKPTIKRVPASAKNVLYVR